MSRLFLMQKLNPVCGNSEKINTSSLFNNIIDTEPEHNYIYDAS